MEKDIVFIGDFKKLIPLGYKFQRLYARNYICYHQEDVWIWRKGKQVEISDMYSRSYLLLEYLIEQNFIIPNEFNMVVVNTESNEIEEYQKEKHSDIYFYDKLTEEEMNQFYKRYQKKFIRQETIDCLKELYGSGLIQVKVKDAVS